jgi:hypothetical protein
MAPNEKQIKAIDTILGCISYWKVTNDINSPSHFSLIDEDLENFEEEFGFTDNRLDHLKECLEDILFAIRKIK